MDVIDDDHQGCLVDQSVDQVFEGSLNLTDMKLRALVRSIIGIWRFPAGESA
jgi:hypothetical protein